MAPRASASGVTRDSLLPQRTRFYRVCTTKVVRHAGGRPADLGGPRARMQACVHASVQGFAHVPSPIRGSWRQNRCAEGPSPARCRGSPRQRAINDSFECVQKRSRARIDNLYNALSSNLTLIITLTNFLPKSMCGGARRWSRVAELWVGPGREGGGRSGGRCAARGGHGTLQREACRARVGAERARPCAPRLPRAKLIQNYSVGGVSPRDASKPSRTRTGRRTGCRAWRAA